jgi:heme/copper-type cytochrome/quinol oxidase subunit 1
MTQLASRFFGSAIIYAVLGMTLGLVMGMTQDHSQMPTHAHLMLLGWVSFAIFGVFYQMFPSAAANRLANVHFWLAQASLIVMLIGLFLIFSDRLDRAAGVDDLVRGDRLAAGEGGVGSLVSGSESTRLWNSDR